MILLFDGDWITTYFRLRWVNERSEDVIRDLCAMAGLDRELVVDVLSGNKKIQSTLDGCRLAADWAKEIDGKPLVDVNG